LADLAINLVADRNVPLVSRVHDTALNDTAHSNPARFPAAMVALIGSNYLGPTLQVNAGDFLPSGRMVGLSNSQRSWAGYCFWYDPSNIGRQLQPPPDDACKQTEQDQYVLAIKGRISECERQQPLVDRLTKLLPDIQESLSSMFLLPFALLIVGCVIRWILRGFSTSFG
jgi:hypothetical protein